MQRGGMKRTSYHHGQLPQALLQATSKLITEVGVGALSLREVARRAGVSHGAPAHHFGDKAGLINAFATQGFRLFTEALTQARDRAGSHPLHRFAATGHAYVLFADTHRAYFEVMFRPELLRADDAELIAAGTSAFDVLRSVVAEAQASGYLEGRDPEIIAVTAWSQAHGMATLWLTGNLRLHTTYPTLERLASAVFLPSSPSVAVTKRNKARRDA